MVGDMYEQFKNMSYLYGDNIYVQMPNGVFRDLSSSIKSKNNTNIQQASFAYAYLVIIAFLYKYAHFVDFDNGTYIQNADIKELLGYSKSTKTVDYLIKKGGILDDIGLTSTTKDYPVRFTSSPNEKINGIPLREFVTIRDIDEDDFMFSLAKKIVKNRNYEVKEPTFLFEYNGDNGTLYEYSNTHRVTIKEVMEFIEDDTLDNIDFSIYCYIKSKAKNYKNNTRQIPLATIVSELGVGKDAFYNHTKILKDKLLIDVIHKGFTFGAVEDDQANEYTFLGV